MTQSLTLGTFPREVLANVYLPDKPLALVPADFDPPFKALGYLNP